MIALGLGRADPHRTPGLRWSPCWRGSSLVVLSLFLSRKRVRRASVVVAISWLGLARSALPRLLPGWFARGQNSQALDSAYGSHQCLVRCLGHSLAPRSTPSLGTGCQTTGSTELLSIPAGSRPIRIKVLSVTSLTAVVLLSPARRCPDQPAGSWTSCRPLSGCLLLGRILYADRSRAAVDRSLGLGCRHVSTDAPLTVDLQIGDRNNNRSLVPSEVSQPAVGRPRSWLRAGVSVVGTATARRFISSGRGEGNYSLYVNGVRITMPTLAFSGDRRPSESRLTIRIPSRTAADFGPGFPRNVFRAKKFEHGKVTLSAERKEGIRSDLRVVVRRVWAETRFAHVAISEEISINPHMSPVGGPGREPSIHGVPVWQKHHDEPARADPPR